MTTVKLKVAELRKKKGVGQQELAEILGVSFQSVSKWETGVTMPDITLLPSIAEYFEVTVDEVLGLKPSDKQVYMPRRTDNRNNWNSNSDKFHISRKYIWNDDYFQFLVETVWKIKTPVDIIDFRCGDGYLGIKFLDLLPEGSTYTGIDNEHYVNEAQKKYEGMTDNINFVVSDLYSLNLNKKYDIAILQVGLRHMNKPMEILSNMIHSVKNNGLVIGVEINREFENAGFYFDGIDYDYLCTAFDFHKLWRKELEYEGRDYAIGMRLPFYMQHLGLHDIDVRMDDKVVYVNPSMDDYEEQIQDFKLINGWNNVLSHSERENIIEMFMNRGSDRREAEAYINMQTDIAQYFLDIKTKKSFLKVHGLMVSYGRK